MPTFNYVHQTDLDAGGLCENTVSGEDAMTEDKNSTSESDLLVPFEIQNIPTE